MNKNNNELSMYVFLGILCAQGIVLGIVEQFIPSPISVVPGAKIGLTNIITLVALMILPFDKCILLTFLRLIITALISGRLSTLIYAACGAFLSLFLMKICFFLFPKFFSLIGISIVGGVSHNFGQLLIASLIAQSKYVMLYLPMLTIMGILAGLIVGITGNYLLKYITAVSFIKRNL